MEFISSLAIITFFLLLLLLAYYFLRHNYSNPYKLPPEAGGAKPFTGHLHLMGAEDGQLPYIKLSKLADKHGPIFTIRLGLRRVLVVSSSKLAKELLTTHDAAVSSRPPYRAAKHLSHNFARLSFTPYGAYWRNLRKLVSTKLLSARSVELVSHVSESESASFVKGIYKLWEEKKDGSSGRALVDMKRWFGDLNFNTIIRMVAGKRFSDGDADETRRCREVMRDFFQYLGVFVLGDALPYFGWLDIGGHERRMKKIAIDMDRMVGRWLEEHRHKKFPRQEDFMDVMISAIDKDPTYGVDTIIKATCEALMTGGTDTVTITSIWAFSLLLNNPHILKKAQDELDEHVGRYKRVNFSDIGNLVYLQAIVKEALRLYPASPLGGPRIFTKDCTIGGFHIPKGTWLIMNLWKLHRDPSVWPDNPMEFNPDRFFMMDKNLDFKGQDFELIPFGGGRRICPGVNLALQMLHLGLANLLHAFEFSTVNDEMVDMTESFGLTTSKATPLEVLVAPRMCSSFYN